MSPCLGSGRHLKKADSVDGFDAHGPPRYIFIKHNGEHGNPTTFGLGSGVWTRNVSKAHRLAKGLLACSVWINCICDRDAVVRALESGQLAGYAGDVWQPAPPYHPWRTMPHHGMTPHTSGTSLSAQTPYAAGTRETLECWVEGRRIRPEYLIVDSGRLAGTRAHSVSARPPELGQTRSG